MLAWVWGTAIVPAAMFGAAVLQSSRDACVRPEATIDHAVHIAKEPALQVRQTNELVFDRIDVPHRPRRHFGSGRMNERFRARWDFASGGLAAADRLGLRRRLGFPRSSR